MWKITFFGLKLGQDLKNWAAHPHQEFQGVHPGVCVWLFTTPSGVRTFFASGGCCNKTRDTQEHILLTGFMKKMQRNVLNITVTKQHLKQVWFYIFICGTTQPEYAGTNYHKSSDCFEYPKKTLL